MASHRIPRSGGVTTVRVSRRGSTSISTGSAGSIGGGATYYGNSPGALRLPRMRRPACRTTGPVSATRRGEAVDRALGKLSPTKQGDYSDAVSRLPRSTTWRTGTRRALFQGTRRGQRSPPIPTPQRPPPPPPSSLPSSHHHKGSNLNRPRFH